MRKVCLLPVCVGMLLALLAANCSSAPISGEEADVPVRAGGGGDRADPKRGPQEAVSGIVKLFDRYGVVAIGEFHGQAALGDLYAAPGPRPRLPGNGE
jgi:hypothetical protein